MREPSPPVLFGRWRPVRLLAERAESWVLLLEDRDERESRWVLKLVRAADADAIDAARREFWLLRQLQHPFVAEVREFGTLDAAAIRELEPLLGPPAGGLPDGAVFVYLTFDHFDGVPLDEAYRALFQTPAVPPSGEVWSPARGAGARTGDVSRSWRAFLEALMKVCAGLAHIHSRGLVHYDIKPANLLIAPKPDGGPGTPPAGFDVRIIDFGLCELETTPLGTRARGTAPFIAPEVLSRSHADRRSDLFSLGVAIAWSIAGRAPFPGDSPGAWLESAREGKAVELETFTGPLPRGLSRLVERLLAPDPEDRPQTAHEVIRELEAIAGFAFDERAERAPRPLPATGYERELNLIRGEIEQMMRDDSAVTLVLVESGWGHFESVFLAEIETMARTRRAAFVSGMSAHPRRAAYQPFWEVLERLRARIDFSHRKWRRFQDILEAFLGPSGMTPRAALDGAPRDLDSSTFVDRLTELFLEIGREEPLVLCFRDLHRAGAAVERVVASLARTLALEREDSAGSSRPSRLLVLATFDEVEPDSEGYDEARGSARAIHELAEAPYSRRLRLRNLPMDRLQEWLAERAPGLDLSSRLLQRLFEASHGKPRVLDELARRLEPERIQTGSSPFAPAAEARSSDPRVDEVAFALPPTFEESVLARMDALPARDRDLLNVLAAAGQEPLELETLAAVADRLGREGRGASSRAVAARPRGELEPGGDVEELRERLRQLEGHGFIELWHGPERLEAAWSSEQARLHAYRRLRRRRRQLLHRLLAEALLMGPAGAPARIPEDVAYHARLGGLRAVFVRSALETAERLERLHDPESATSHYERILEEISSAPEPPARSGALARPERDELSWTIHSRLVELYREQRMLPRALEKLTVLLSLHGAERTPLELARVYRQMGEIYHESGETTSAAHFFEKSLHALAACEDRYDARGAAGAAGMAGGGDPIELARTLVSFGRFLLRRGELDPALQHLETCREIARGEGELAAVRAESCLLLAELHARKNDSGRRLSLSRLALEAAEKSGHDRVVAKAIRAVGDAHVARGENDEATECIRRGIRFAEKRGSKAEAALCYNALGTIQYNRGDHHRALETYQKSLALSRRLGDERGIAKSYNNLGMVCRFREQTEKAAEYYKLAIDIFSKLNSRSSIATCMNNLSGVLEREGKYNEALEYAYRALEKRKRSSSRSGIAFSYYRIGMIYHSKGELAKAIGYAERSLRIRRELDEKVGIAYSLLELADLHLGLGNLSSALEECREGIRVFEELDNRTGELMGREILGSLLVEVGAFDDARQTLGDAIERARKEDIVAVVGRGLLHLGLLDLEEGQLSEAERNLAEAERLFRTTRNQRRLIEALMALSALFLEMGQHERCEGHLEESYSLLEGLGIRDLVPLYFLLRGRFVAEASASDLEPVHKFLQRGLFEARELELRDLYWRFHVHLGRLEERRGDFHLARIHFHEAREALEEMRGRLPPDLQEGFFRPRERTAALRSSARSVQEPEPPAGSGAALAEPSARDAREARPLHDPALQATMNQELIRLHEIVMARGREKSLDRLLARIMDAVIDLSKAERGFLILKEERSRGGRIIVARNFDKEEIGSPKGKYSGSVSRRVMETGEPVIAGNALSEEPFEGLRSVRELRLRSILCVPLKFHGEVLGAIYVDNRHRRHAFQESELKTLQTFSDQAAIAIATARLIEAQEHSNIKLRNQIHRRTVQLAVAQRDLEHQQSLLEARYQIENIAGKSPAMEKVLFLVRRVASSRLPILLEGESGTGKELIARSIHFMGDRRKGRFVSENCAALSESLLESELFGHTRDAFTGAVAAKKGLIEQAHGGTLFLDEVADMSLGMQQKLLRALEQGEIRPLGSDRTLAVDVRVISASNRELERLVEEGTFREDLYYRLNAVRIRLPPLRERLEDVPDLVRAFATRAAAELGIAVPEFSPGAMRRLMEHEWPGNVRELRHLVERTLLICPGKKITENDLLFDASPRESASGGVPGELQRVLAGAKVESFRGARDVFERCYLQSTLERAEGNISRAADLSGLSRESLYRLLKKHEITRRS